MSNKKQTIGDMEAAGEIPAASLPYTTADLAAAHKREHAAGHKPEYTWAQLEAAAVMWEYVLRELRRPRTTRNFWEEYRVGYSLVELRCAVIRHAPELYAAYEAALANGYDKGFDYQFVPQYMNDHVTRILA